MILLPAPPSTNGLFIGTGKRKRTKSPAYQAWLQQAGWVLKLQHPAAHTGKVSISLHVPETCRNDLDNCFKATLDLLVTHQVIPDDSKKHVRKISAEWIEGDKMGVQIEGVL